MATVQIVARPPRFTALQYDGTNEPELAAFIGFLFKPSTSSTPPAYYDPAAQMLRPIEPGMWVTLVGTSLSILTPQEFSKAFDIVPD